SDLFAQSGNQVGVTIPRVGYEALPTSGDTSAAWTKAAQDSVMAVIDEARLSNGDPIVTTAFAAARAQDGNFEAIASDLQVAKDYETYLANTAAINQMLEQNPDSAFAAGWELTLLRAEELGLTQVPNEPGWKANLVNGSASSTAVENVYENNGILVEEIDFNADGSQTDRQYYKNLTVALSNVTLEVLEASTWTITGSGDTVTGERGSIINLTGNNNTVTVSGPQAAVNVAGADDVVSINLGWVNAAAASSVIIDGNNDAISGGNDTTLTVSGTAEAIAINGSSLTLTN